MEIRKQEDAVESPGILMAELDYSNISKQCSDELDYVLSDITKFIRETLREYVQTQVLFFGKCHESLGSTDNKIREFYSTTENKYFAPSSSRLGPKDFAESSSLI
eukprot:TRINITY_DN122775_c0_g1_i1.p2 TRINITY_DN122775_c0_g1~~TRINITY_DN122775_c0_g1_i1.p2  ORF type:complete len:105 (+),score=7.02 TRINITY_DN122775_c0_g1_i1:558-872(+)